MDPLRPDTFTQPDFNSVQLVNDVLAVLTNPNVLSSSTPTSAASSSSSSSSSSTPYVTSTDNTSVNNVEQALSGMLVRLQLLGSEYTARADTNMARIIASLPRAKRDAKTIALETPPLHQNVTSLLSLHKNITGLADMDTGHKSNTVNGESINGESGNSSSLHGSSSNNNQKSNHYLQELELLDTVSSRLEQVQSLLIKVCTWDRLVRETEMIFTVVSATPPKDKLRTTDTNKGNNGNSGGNSGSTDTEENSRNNPSTTDDPFYRMAEHILALEQTAMAIQDMPEHDSRLQYVNDTKQLFYSTIFPILVETVATMSIPNSRNTTDATKDTSTVSTLYTLLNTFQYMNALDQAIDIIALLRIYPLVKKWNEFTVTVDTVPIDPLEKLMFSAGSIVTQQEYAKLTKLISKSNTAPFSTFITEYYHSLVRILSNEVNTLPLFFSQLSASSSTTVSSLVDACIVKMVLYAIGSSGTYTTPLHALVTSITNKLFHPFLPSFPSPLEFRLRLETEFAHNLSSASLSPTNNASLIDMNTVIQLHNIATATAHEIIRLFDQSPIVSNADRSSKHTSFLSIIFDAFAAPYLWYTTQLEQFEKESIHELFQSIPNLRLPLPLPEESSILSSSVSSTSSSTLIHPLHFVAGFDGNFASLMTFAQTNKLFLPSLPHSPSVPTTIAPSLLTVESAIKGLEEAVHRFATLSGQIIERTVQLNSFVHGYATIQVINEGITDLAQRLYATASLLADVTVFPVVTAAATTVYHNQQQNTTVAKQLSSPFGTVTRASSSGGTSNGSGSTGNTNSPVTNVVLPSLRDVYTLAVRIWLLAADIETLTLTVPSCTFHIVQQQKTWLEEPLVHCIHGGNTSKDNAFVTTDMRAWESYAILANNVTTREKLQKILQEQSNIGIHREGSMDGSVSSLSSSSSAADPVSLPSVITPVYKAVWNTVQSSKHHCNRLLFDALLAPFVEHIRNVRNLPCWSGNNGKDSVGSTPQDRTAALTDEILQYNTSPSSYITEICNLLLSFAQFVAPNNHPLVQLHQKNTANTTGNSTGSKYGGGYAPVSFPVINVGKGKNTDNTDNSCDLPPLAALAAYCRQASVSGPLFGYLEQDTVRNKYRKRALSMVHRIQQSTVADTVAPVFTLRGIGNSFGGAQYVTWTRTVVRSDTEEGNHANTFNATFALTSDQSNEGVTASVTLLLQGIVRALSSYLLYEYTQIPYMESNGIQQCIADLDYLAAVLNSMGFTMDPWFTWWMDCLQLTPMELRTMVSSLNSGNGSGSAGRKDDDIFSVQGITDEEKKLLGQCMMLMRRVQ